MTEEVTGIDAILLEHAASDTTEPEDAIDWFLAAYENDIEWISRREAGSRHYIDKEDVAQAIRLAVTEEWAQFRKVQPNQVKAMLKRRAQQYIQREVTDYMHFTGAYIYTPAQVRHHLESSAWTDLEGADVDARADLYAAWTTLSPTRRRAVYRRYALDMDPSEVPEAERKAVNRGIDDIAAHMNRNVPEAVSFTQEIL